MNLDDDIDPVSELPGVYLLDELKNVYQQAYLLRDKLTKECCNIMISDKRHQYYKNIKDLTSYFEEIHRVIIELKDLRPQCLYET